MSLLLSASDLRGITFRATLNEEVINVAAADDFGALRLRDIESKDLLPTQNLLIVGAELDLSVQVLGFTSNTVGTLAFGLGTATASLGTILTLAPLAQNVMAQFAASGSGSIGTVSRNANANTATGLVQMNSTTGNPIFLNVVGACTAASTVTVSGNVFVHAFVLGSL